MAIYLIRYLNVPPNTIPRHGQRAPRPGQTPATILPVMCVAAQARRRGGRGSEELDAGLARHLPRLWRRLGNDENRAGLSDLGQFEDEARAGEEIVEAYTGRRQSFQVSPATMLRLLLLHRRPSPQEVRDQPELPRRLIGTIIQEFDTVADDHGLNTAIGRSTVLPMIIRLRLLAGLAIVMKNPLEQLSRLRQSRAFGPQFDRVLAQDPILTPNALLQSHLT